MFKKAWNFLSIEREAIKKALYVISVLAILILIFLVIRSPHYYIYDERYFFPNMAYLKETGILHFVATYKNQAPGPLYEFVHYFNYVTFESIYAARIENMLLAILNIFILWQILKEEKYNFLTACIYIIIPLSWANSGITLTETPTILFSLLFFYTLSKNIDKPKVGIQYIVIMAMFLTLSIIGRSTFLMQIPALVLFFFYKLKSQKYFIIPTVLLALLVPMYVFYTWGGLVPPDVAFVSDEGFSLHHFVLSLSYTGIVVFIMYPNSMTIVFRKPLAMGIVFALVLIYLNTQSAFVPFQTVDLSGLAFMPFLETTIYSAAAAFFIIAVYTRFVDEEENFYLVVLIFALLLLATSIRITHLFSTRYVFQAVPFLILIFRKYYRANLFQVAFAIGGVIMGIISLLGYYRLA